MITGSTLSFSGAFNCLGGTVSSEQQNQLSAIASGLPSSQYQLLQLIAALAIQERSVEVLTAEGGFLSGAVNTPTIPEGTTSALITANDSEMMFTFDGDTPSSSTGHVLQADSNMNVSRELLNTMKFWMNGGTYYITYFK